MRKIQLCPFAYSVRSKSYGRPVPSSQRMLSWRQYQQTCWPFSVRCDLTESSLNCHCSLMWDEWLYIGTSVRVCVMYCTSYSELRNYPCSAPRTLESNLGPDLSHIGRRNYVHRHVDRELCNGDSRMLFVWPSAPTE